MVQMKTSDNYNFRLDTTIYTIISSILLATAQSLLIELFPVWICSLVSCTVLALTLSIIIGNLSGTPILPE